jgi:anti-anti-sigma factor
MAKIVILSDANQEIQRLHKILLSAGHSVDIFANLEKCLARIRISCPELVFVANKLTDANAIKAIELIKDLGINRPFVVIAPFSESGEVAQAIKKGAFDFLPTPLDPGEVSACIARALADAKELDCLESVRFEAREGCLIMSFPEEMSFEATHKLGKLLSEGLPMPDKGVVIDLSRTQYFSSSGVSNLFLIYQMLDTMHKKMVVCGGSRSVFNILKLAGATEILTFAGSVEEGIIKLAE